MRYPVPRCLYRTVLSPAGMDVVFDGGNGTYRGEKKESPQASFRPWFFAVAQGEPFAIIARKTFTRREAHWFLQSPERFDIGPCIEWARYAAAGIPLDGCDYLVETHTYWTGEAASRRLPEVRALLARIWCDIPPTERQEILDFIWNRTNDPEFSFSGRTYASLRRLSEEWHRRFHGDWYTIDEVVSWDRAFDPWEHRVGSWVYRAQELTSNRELLDESNHQIHCVFTYADRCLTGGSRIVSFRLYDEGEEEVVRLTIEVMPNRREIVQIRGHLNRRATEPEMRIIRLWAEKVGLTIQNYAN